MGERSIVESELFSQTLKLAALNNGDQTARLQNTHDFMVLQSKWLSESQFNEIHSLCHNLPGPTTTQVIITIITLKLRSISTAITCFLLYNLIPWIMLTVLGYLSKMFLQQYDEEHKLIVKMVIMGCIAAGAGIMVRSLFESIKDIRNSPVKIVLMAFTALIFYLYKSQNAIILCLAIGSIVSLYL